ncbi:unnamed protein product [Adineta steineri]|uniref:Uncharacterized protein n=1 Tax=Adineta steineri TaxID=433720 RepID=A0A815IYR1_9BILA|nr:unnamed protein product [Adineta steineri]CAF1605454.1 unnamed protein product [Adineta steineri]
MFSAVISRSLYGLLCPIAGLGLATHIFAPESQSESLVRFCHACINMNEQPMSTFLSSTQVNFLLSLRSTSSKLIHLLLIISPNQAQHLPVSYDYSSSSIQILQQKRIMDKFDRPIVNKILDYVVNLFSDSVLDQLADKILIPIDFDDYLPVFDDNEVQEEYKKSKVVAENVFEALLLKNVFITDKVPSTTDIILTGIVYIKYK